MKKSDNKQKPAFFLDRDGTVCEEVGYLSDIRNLRLIAGSAEAIRRINNNNWKVVIITNQSGVSKGYMDEETVRQINDALLEMLREENVRVDGIYYCPHHLQGNPPYNISCECRKPASGMLRQASKDLDIDIRRSVLVGDKLTDVETANRLDIPGILVRTGFGREESRSLISPVLTRPPAYIAEDLLDAVRWWYNRKS
ncbi:MAG: HAD family hydrolase [Calditrichaeota bacterium]|nr:HAD family hydrolase [Calditrichota bacterium]